MEIKKRLIRWTAIIAIVAVSVILLAGIAFTVYVAVFVDKDIDADIFEALGGSSGSAVYCYENTDDREAGVPTELVGQELYGGFRSIPVDYASVPKELIYAFVSIEDKRFFEHKGVDWIRTLGAGANYFLNFRDEFGGSTITQQLIKNVTEEDEYSLDRKLREIFRALDLETKLSKEEILGGYLNIINLANGCYGVGAASDYYFSKKVEELTLCECAAIAAITNNPSYYDPVRYPENNKKRRQLILSQMCEQGYISAEELEQAYDKEITLDTDGAESQTQINMWYVDMAVNDVINDLMVQKGYNRATASMLIYTGGLKIYTAMDAEIQSILESYYAKESNFMHTEEGGPQSSMIIIDPYSGDILAVAGAVGVKNANRLQNFATETVRPAGSVIKPLSVYAPALESGTVNYATVYDDVPVRFTQTGSSYVAWPKNANGVYRGLTNVNYAIQHSVNTVTVKVLEDIGLDTSFDFLKNKLGMSSLIDSRVLEDGSVITDRDYAALALGQFNYGVTLRETVNAYSPFINQGVYSEYRSYHKVTDRNGNIILEKPYRGETVISEETSAIMTEMLKNVVEEGTAREITLKKNIECAGKTGTTQSNYDRWFIGYTPYLLGGVWYGHEYPKELPAATANVCEEIWDEIMTAVHRRWLTDGEGKEFARADGVVSAEYCRDSGKLATDACRSDLRGDRTEEGYFTADGVPTEKCETHVSVAYDIAEGAVATPDCPHSQIKYVGMLRVERSFPTQVFISDAEYVWSDIGDALPETSPSLPFFAGALAEGEYRGISYGETQSNCYCRAHFDYFKWLEKKDTNR